jgi:sensor domain CHASE-containing protein
MQIPKSTLIVGAAFWSVIVGMQIWMINRQEATSDAASQLKGDVREINIKLQNVNEKVGDVKQTQNNMDLRLSNMEQRQIQATR